MEGDEVSINVNDINGKKASNDDMQIDIISPSKSPRVNEDESNQSVKNKSVDLNDVISNSKSEYIIVDSPINNKDEIFIDKDLNIIFDKEEVECKVIKIIKANVVIEKLNLKGSIVVEDGSLTLIDSLIHEPDNEPVVMMMTSKSSKIYVKNSLFCNSDGFGIHVDDESKVFFSKCNISNIRYSAFLVTRNSALDLESCIIESVEGDAINLESCSSLSVGHCEILNVLKHALSTSNASTVRIRCSIIKDCGLGGIYASHTNYLMIEHSSFTQLNHTALFLDVSNAKISNCFFSECNGNGINASRKSSIFLVKNNFRETAFPAIALCESSVGLVSQCGIQKSKLSGIIVRSSSYGVIDNCSVEDVEQFGLVVSDSENVQVKKSLFVGCKHSCVGCYNHSTLEMKGCYLLGPGNYGMDIFTGGRVISKDTTFIGHTKTAIYAHHGGTCSVYNSLVDTQVLKSREDVRALIDIIDITSRGKELELDKLVLNESSREVKILTTFIVGYGTFDFHENAEQDLPLLESDYPEPKCKKCGGVADAYYCCCGHRLYCHNCWKSMDTMPLTCELCLMPTKGVLQPINLSNNEAECAICLDRKCNAVIVPCGHSICWECARRWLSSSPTCPFCRETPSKSCRAIVYE